MNKCLLHMVVVFSVCLAWCIAKPCLAAKDTRLALLIANQRGWKQDPPLRYVVKGDLRPMASALKQLGFEVFGVLENQGPATLRQTLKKLAKRLGRKPQVTTFFFYYSGHADKGHFHMGKRGKSPFSYKELIRFFAGLQVRRRFAVIDACFSGEIIRQFGSLKQFRVFRQKHHLNAKGIERKLVISDLRKYLPDQGSRTRGLQIISSSRHLSFESSMRKSSVFTYHFLQGLRGAADLDKDGKIAMNELFLYTKPRVKKETGQSPQQWLFREGSETYGFAPAYRSILQIGPSITGKLRVSVGGFVWHSHKRYRKPLRLAIGAGQGEVWVRSKQRCYRGQLFFPQQGQTNLRLSQLSSTTCATVGLRSKAGVSIQARVMPPPTPAQAWNLSLLAGPRFSSGALQRGGDVAVGGSIGLRRRFFALSLEANGASIAFSQNQYTQLSLALRGELGYRRMWGNFDLFLGGYASLGVLLQDLNQTPSPGLLAHAGFTTNLAYWLGPRWALTLALDAGLLPLAFNSTPRFFFLGGIRVGVRFSLL